MTIHRRATRVTMTVWLLIVCAVSFTGCGKSGPSSRGGLLLGLLSHSEAGKKSVPGIDQFSVVAGDRDRELVYVVWFDQSAATVASTGSTTYEAKSVRGDGREFTITCSTEDGKSGVVTIDGRAYPLADGAFFLVSANGDPLRVKQRHYDLKKLPTGGLPLRDFAMKDREIMSFYAGVAPAKEP